MKKYEPVIGLEIHVQLKTKSKMFCSCDNNGEDKPPNTTICPICMAHPGTLPTTNAKAVRWAIMAAYALNCQINKQSHFDRKSYFYPDLPKGYQISQFSSPFGLDGYLIVENGKHKDRVSIERVHLEEDTGKLMHEKDRSASYVDYNRAGTPLLEIVTKPDVDSPASARIFLQEIRMVMRYLGISTADMEKGQLRCDANISLRPDPEFFKEKAFEPGKLYPKTEIKNLNSFKSVEKSLEYEIKRQTKLWEKGQAPTESTTRGWEEKMGVTLDQRTKEEAHDYRYFPEPDIPHFNFDQKYLNSIKMSMVELPYAKRKRFRDLYGLGEYDVNILITDKNLADYFESVISELKSWILSLEQVDGSEEEIWDNNKKKLVKSTANWVISRLLNLLNKENLSIKESKITPENFAELIKLVFERKLNNSTALIVLGKMFLTKKDPSNIMEDEELGQMNDDEDLDKIIDGIIKENKNVVDQYLAGKEVALQFLIGQAMKETKGRADAKKVGQTILSKIK